MGDSEPQSSPPHDGNSLYNQGIILAAVANIWWGLSPLFWKQLGDFEAFTLVAHRVTWSFVALAVIQTLRCHWQPLREIATRPKNLAFASVTAAMLFMNWIVFIWAVNHDRVTEAAILFVPMAGYLVWLQIGETPSITLSQGGINFLLVATALVTTVPLVTFARAVRLVPLSIAGLFQYLNPSLQFLVGVLIYSESFEGGQVIGYLIIGSGLAIFAIEAAFDGNRESKRPSASVNLDHASSIDS